LRNGGEIKTQKNKELDPIMAECIKPASHPDLPWRELLLKSIVTAEQIAECFPVDVGSIRRVLERYPMRINPYYFSLIRRVGDPLWLQAIPDIQEIDDDSFTDPDPLWEEAQSPTPLVIHRYPDRVVFLVSSQCAIYCRHCMRKRRVGRGENITQELLEKGIGYIRSNPAIREVILSGGDPFLLPDDCLEWILGAIGIIPHIDILRIHTRVPCVLPQRITGSLVKMLKQFHPLYINIQFNHPDEITHESTAACAKLADAGIPLGSQTVLLKGVNDDADVMTDLMRNLMRIRVKPYYLHHGDPVCGTGHFRTSVAKGLEIMSALYARIDPMGIPQYVVDLPKGGGKVPLIPDDIFHQFPVRKPSE
jgi:lysine 2,3-aminomutase